jgi:TolB-like protein/class 3 adenylate cyclase/Tfp pilus assembly protein PilF
VSQSRQLAAIMFTDIVGYTAMMQANEQKAVAVIKHYNSTLEKFVTQFNGQVLNYYGDGSLCIFSSATDAVNCSLAVQKDLKNEPAVPLRIGLHIGEVFFEDAKALGDGVNVASRVQSLGQENTILISEEVHNKIKNNVSITAASLGLFEFKNVGKSMEVFALTNDGLFVPQRKKMEGKLKKKNLQKRNIIAALSFILLIVAAFFIYKKILSKNDEASDKSIAVLPLENLSGNPEQEYFVSGMHETLITELSKISALKVISRTSSIQYKNVKKPLRQIAKELGVKALIEGSVIREGNMVRITVQLIDGTTDEHIWSGDFDRELQNILSLYSEVAQKIANEVKINLTPQDQVRLVSSQEVNPYAYELYLIGRHHWNQRTIEGYKQAIESYNKALEQDSNYAPAYAALADGYLLLGEQGGIPQQEAGRLADIAIKKALVLNSNLAEAYSSKGVWKLSYEWNWSESEKAFKQAIELNPGYAVTYQWYGRILGFAGRFDEAIKQLEKAKELDPLSPIIVAYIGQIYIFAKEYEKADDHLQQALKVHPNHPLILHNIGELYIAQGRYAEAIAPLKQSAEMSVSGHYKAMLGYAYAMANRRAEAMSILNELLTRSDSGIISGFNLAAVYLALGEKEKSLSQLEKGFEQRDVWMKELKAWPWFDKLRDEQRYKDLMKRMNFPE